MPAGMTGTSGEYGWAGGFGVEGQFVQINLLNESIVKFTYKATANCYVVLNLGVETWNDGTYSFKILVNGEEVYSKVAAREQDAYANVENLVAYLEKDQELQLVFQLQVPEGFEGTYERSFFVRKNELEVLTVESKLATPEGFESLQQYVDLDGILPSDVIDTKDELMAEIENGAPLTMGTAFTNGVLKQQVVYGETVFDIQNGVTETFKQNNWTNGFVSETNNIQMNMGLLNGVAPVINFKYTAEENSYIVLSMDVESWRDDITVLINVSCGGESVYSKSIYKEVGTGAGVVDTISQLLVYVPKGETCTISFSYEVPADVAEFGGTYYLRNTAVEVIQVKEKIDLA